MQKAIHHEGRHLFDKTLKEHLDDGWTVVPGTYSASSHQIFVWDVTTNDNTKLSMRDDFFIVVKKEVSEEPA